MKTCKKCNLEKENLEFLNGKKGLTLKTCRECRKKISKLKRKENLEQCREKDKIRYQEQKEKRVLYAREYRKKYPERTRETNLKSTYGISSKDFNEKLEYQNHKCAICGRTQESYRRIFCVDHNHTTGQIRGLLCDPCNYGLGFYEKHREKYIKYLKEYNEM